MKTGGVPFVLSWAVLSACAFPARADRVYTAADYVRQTDLIACWDGVDNVATGTHDPNATSWVDVARGNAIAIASGTVCDDSVQLTASHAFSGLFAGLTDFDVRAPITVEVCCRRTYEPTPSAGDRGTAISLNGIGSITQDLRGNSGSTGNFTLSHNQGARGRTFFFHIDNKGTKADLLVDRTFGAVFKTNNLSLAYYDGKAYAVGTSSFWNSESTDYGSGSLGNADYLPDYHCVRIYKGELTATEMKFNTIVDGIRFRNWDYRIEDGIAQAGVTVLTSDSSVSTGGVAVAGKVWVGLGGDALTGTLTLTATPDPGCTFKEWTGDTSAIVSGTAQSATITVSVTQPLALQAVSTPDELAELVVSENTTLHEDAFCLGIRFTGGYTLSADPGVTVRIANNGAGVKVESGTATLACPVTFGTSASSERIPIDVAGGASLCQTGSWSGKASLFNLGAGTLQLYGDNTFEGTFFSTNGAVQVHSPTAFGSAAAGAEFVFVNRGSLAFKESVTIADTLYVYCSDSNQRVSIAAGKTVTMNGGYWTQTNRDWPTLGLTTGLKSQCRNTLGANARWILNGPSYCGSNFAVTPGAGSRIDFDVPLSIGNWYTGGDCEIWFNAPVTIGSVTFDGVKSDSADLEYHFNCTNAVRGASKPTAVFAKSAPIHIDMHGCDQTFRYFVESSTYDSEITSAETAVMHFVESADGISDWSGPKNGSKCSARFTGKAGVSVDNTLPFTLLGASTSQGPLVASTNSLLTVSGSWAGTNVRVDAGGTLVLSSGTALATEARIVVDTSAGASNVRLPDGVVQIVRTVTVNGEPLAAGTYGSPSNTAGVVSKPWLSGLGALYVLGEGGEIATDGTWDGGAGADTGFAVPANWVGDIVPEHVLGLVNVTFAADGEQASLTEGVTVKGVKFTGDRDFTVSAAAGRAFAIGGAGIEIAEPPAGETHVTTFDAACRVNSAQTWCVPGGQRLVFNGVVSSASDGAVSLTGDGTTVFNAANTFVGDLTVNSGFVRANASEAFGSAPGTLNVMADTADGATVSFADGITVSRPVMFRLGCNRPSVLFDGNARVTFAGKATFSPQTGAYLMPTNGAELVFTGGVDGAATLYLQGRGGPARMTVRERPFAMTHGSGEPSVVKVGADMTLTLAAPTNRLSSENLNGLSYFDVRQGGRIVCAVTNALAFGGMTGWNQANTYTRVRLGDGANSCGTLDLGGCDQELDRLLCVTAPGTEENRSYVTSAAPAVLSLSNTVDTVFHGTFAGAASLRYCGPSKFTLAAPQTTTGDLIVEGGTLALGAAVGKFGGDVYLGAAGSLELEAGRHRVQALYVWDADGGRYRMVANGRYASGDFGGRLSGAGTLRVGTLNTSVFVR